MQGRPPPAALVIDVGPHLEQEGHHVSLSGLGGGVEGRFVPARPRVDAGAAREEHPGDLHLPAARRPHERLRPRVLPERLRQRPAQAAGTKVLLAHRGRNQDVRLGPVDPQEPHHVAVALPGGVVDGPIAPRCGKVDLGPGLDQLARGGGLAEPGGLVQGRPAAP